MEAMSTPAYGTPDNGYDTARQNAERIHDAARADADARVADAVDQTVTAVIVWIRANTKVRLTDEQVSRMCKQLEIGAHRAPAAPKRG